MVLNKFLVIKFYALGFGFLNTSQNVSRYIYSIQNNISLIFITKILFQLKKTIYLIQKIAQLWGKIIFLSNEFVYFKHSKSLFSIMLELNFTELFSGSFSNFLYRNSEKYKPDLIFTINSNQQLIFLKETKKLSIPTIGFTTNKTIFTVIEYPIYLDIDSYFLNYFLLQLYSKLIVATKKCVIS